VGARAGDREGGGEGGEREAEGAGEEDEGAEGCSREGDGSSKEEVQPPCTFYFKLSTMANTTNASSTHVVAMTSFKNFHSSYTGMSSIYTRFHPGFASANTRPDMKTASNHLTAEHDTEAEASDSDLSHIQLALRGGTSASEAVLCGGRGFKRIEQISGLEEHERRVEEMVRGRQDANTDAKRPEEDRRASQHPSERKEDEFAGPCYTVFGSTSGRVIAVGSVEDLWDAYGRLGHWDPGLFGQKGAGRAEEKDKDR